jgi:protein tyrosine phosphatase (PTP) superfamily phosphohydrolase (DUF442 family)
MNNMKLLVIGFTTLLAACTGLQRLNVAMVEDSQLMNMNVPETNVLASGQPTPEQIQVLADAGVKHVISLRRPDEIDWDEGAVVTAAGMQFHSLPIGGIDGVTPGNAAKLEYLLNSLGNQPVLVHCGSSNRVGGLRTLTALSANPNDIEAAFATGREWGLTRLEQPMRARLAEQ